MTLEQAIKHTEDLIEWFIEGMAPESEARIREDVDAMETLIASAKERLKEANRDLNR